MPQAITILGSTGSIGQNTLNVIVRHPDKFTVFALTAHKNVERLLQQVQQFHPKHVVVVDVNAGKQFQQQAKTLKLRCEIHVGTEALIAVANAAEVDLVMAAIVGAAGLLPTLAAARAGKRVLLANKEALVMTGELFMQEAYNNGAQILPVDSEHNAIFQCLPAHDSKISLTEMGVKRLILTASGGPFLRTPLAELYSVTPDQACAHPNWSMGRKISVDSATMMNKALEVIEAHWLFNAQLEQIEVLIQPQSVIHSMVEYIDGSVLAELGMPDMRTPIAHVLGLPTRLTSGVASLDFTRLKQLDFLPLELERYPLMRLAYAALAAGNTAPTCLNAANEIAVEAFLQGKIRFLQIATVVEQTLNTVEIIPATTLEAILAVDQQSRVVANEVLHGC